MALHHTEMSDFAVDPIEPLLALDRAAHLLGISAKTLRDWVQYRKIEYVKVGTRVMIRPETIRNFVAHNTRTLRPDERLETSRKPVLFVPVCIQR
jgi:excisionase family DNA binding protein